MSFLSINFIFCGVFPHIKFSIHAFEILHKKSFKVKFIYELLGSAQITELGSNLRFVNRVFRNQRFNITLIFEFFFFVCLTRMQSSGFNFYIQIFVGRPL